MNIKKSMAWLLFAFVLSSLNSIQYSRATVYKTVDENGNIIFTNTLPTNQPGEEVWLRPHTPTPSYQLDRRRPTPIEEQYERKQYTSFEIIQPDNNTTIRNQGNLTVEIAIQPELFHDHRVRLLLDGKLVDTSKQGVTFQLSNIDRGTHTITAELIDSHGKMIRTSSRTIYVHRTIINRSE